MNGLQALEVIVLLEALALITTLVGLVVTTVVVSRRVRSAREHQERLISAIVLDEGGAIGPGHPVQILTAMPRRLQVPTITRLADQVAGAAWEKLAALSFEAGILARAERWSRSRRWRLRLRGVRTLSTLCADQSTLRRLLDDLRPQVRAAAARGTHANSDAKTAERVVRMLDDPAADCRFAAKDALMRVGSASIDPLLAYLEVSTGACAATALEIARSVAAPQLLHAGLTRCRDGAAVVRARAGDLVAAIGGSDAVAALGDMLQDEDPAVRAAAARGLGVLAHLPSAPPLAEAMHDGSWDVRRAAAMALRSFGARGRLYLRRLLRDEDPFAADMARQVLELPQTDEELWTP